MLLAPYVCDTGWKPTSVRLWSSVINQWLRLKSMDSCRLNRKIFDWTERNSNGRCQNWNYRVSKTLREAGILYEPEVTNPRVMKANLADYLFHKFVDSWREDITRINARQGTGRNKLRTYRLFKSVYQTENYLNCLMPHGYRSAYAKFRCGVAPIRLETGRYERLSEDSRTCFNCVNLVEKNEEHVLLKCPVYKDLREVMFRVLSEEFPDLMNMNDQELLSSILNCKINKSIRTCAKTCFDILRTRRGILYN